MLYFSNHGVVSVVLPSVSLYWLSVLLPSNSYFTIKEIFLSKQNLANNFFTSFAGHHKLIFYSQKKSGILTKEEAEDLTLFIFDIQIITVYLRDNCACFTLNFFCNIIILSITLQNVELWRYYERYYTHSGLVAQQNKFPSCQFKLLVICENGEDQTALKYARLRPEIFI